MRFDHAVSNWRASMAEEADIPRHTCGSAERMYADHPERGGARDGPVRFLNQRAAYDLEAMVGRLTEPLRRAWHIRNGFRAANDETDEWINEHYNQARAQLSVWWSLSRR